MPTRKAGTTRSTSTKKKAASSSTSSRSPGRSASSRSSAAASPAPSSSSASGKQLVIVESPSKAKTINKYLGPAFVVRASVGHVRDLPSKNPKGDKSPVPGVDLEHDFKPAYEVLKGKGEVIRELKKLAKQADAVWFATDLDREGEAIAWHLAEELGIPAQQAKRVIFSAITKEEIQRAFANPHAIDLDRVNAQQARRILDRIVGYQVSPLLWKKVARGLSAGRVQSVAVRLVVEREREIRAFVPDEYWAIEANFALSEADAAKLAPAWKELLAQRDEKNNPPTIKSQNAWLADQRAIRAELVEYDGQKFDPRVKGGRATADPRTGLIQLDPKFNDPAASDLTPQVIKAAQAAGLTNIKSTTTPDEKARGPARWKRSITGDIDTKTNYSITSIDTKRTTSRPPAPFITSTLQQAASTRFGFGARRTMSAAQALYEGVDIPGEGPVGLITYMRTDSTHLSGAAIELARNYINKTFGDAYLPQKPNFFTSSNKAAQEAHEAIRPTDPARTPSSLKNILKPDQHRLYTIIWERFVACQMTSAEWDATSVTIQGGRQGAPTCTFRASGRVLAFDGFYKVAGVPTSADTATLPPLTSNQKLNPFAVDALQKFTSPPARYSEASLIKQLEEEGIGRPSTYASIIQVIQDRKYVEQVDRRMYASDLGEVVTDKLIEAFPRIMDVGYTRDMEAQLDKIEEEHLDWIDMLHRFYGPFRESLSIAEDTLKHAKAEVMPAPPEYRCQKCGAELVYRFGKNGRFLSCSTYPTCNYACPIDREGRPRTAEFVNVRCPKTGRPMVRRTGRFGPFLSTHLNEGEPQDTGMILNIDKKGKVTAPSQPPVFTDLPCPKCSAPLNLRNGLRGPWLGCSNFPKCRGRGKWADLDPQTQQHWLEILEKHDRQNPIPTITTLDGRPLTDNSGKPKPDAPTVEELLIEEDQAKSLANKNAEAA